MSANYPQNPDAPPVVTQPYPGPPPVFTQPYPGAPPVFTQPYPANNQPYVIVQHQQKEVQHGCHLLLCFFTGGLWAPCWIAACCGCCCERPC